MMDFNLFDKEINNFAEKMKVRLRQKSTDFQKPTIFSTIEQIENDSFDAIDLGLYAMFLEYQKNLAEKGEADL